MPARDPWTFRSTQGKLNRHQEEWIRRGPLRLWRITRGLTLQQAAEVFGVPLTTLHEWERNGRVPNDDLVERVCSVLGTGSRKRWLAWAAARPPDIRAEDKRRSLGHR